MKSPTRFAAAAGAVVAAVSFGATAALASGGSSGHDDEQVLRAGIVGSLLEDPTLFKAKPGSAPWVIDEGQARLSGSGALRVEVEGLVIPGRGNPVPQLSASVACGGEVVATTAAVPFDAMGNARIKAMVMLPDRCLAPVVMLNPNGNAGTYIAVTGG